MSDRAIFNLVRTGVLSATEGVDYTSGSVAADDHDEVVLLDIFGEPCANPQLGNDDDRSIVHEYADASEGRTPVAQLKTIGIAVDFLGNDTFQKLARWKAADAQVQFSPGYGRRTEFAWRPLETSGATISDLTGKYTLGITGDATRDALWDNATGLRLMRNGFTGKQRIVRTPGGAGQLFEGATTNRFTYDQPASGTPGWTAGGAGSATITLAHVADGFGHTDFPHSVRVTGTAATTARSLSSEAMPSAVDGQGVLDVCIYVKGRFPTGAAIGCLNATGVTYLNGEYGDWTPVWCQFLDTFVDAENPYIYIDLTTAATAEQFDFELGPRTAVFRASASQYACAYPQVQAVGAARTADVLTTTANMAWPRNGSVMSTFFVPADYNAARTSQWVGLCRPGTGSTCELSLLAYNGNTRLRAIFYYDYAGAKYVAGYADGGLIVPGAVNTITATWKDKAIYLYVNGSQIASSTATTNGARSFAATTLKLGDIGAQSFLLNGLRLEREPWTADRVMQEHITATDPRALGVTLQARGRTFKIVSLPTNQRVTAGGSYWTGNIVLKQVGYSSALADIVTKEVL